MTFDLGVWSSLPGLPATSASFIYSALCEGKRDARLLPAGAAVSAFYEELVATWPEVSVASKSRTSRKGIDSPWAGPLLRADDYVLMSCEFQYAEIALAFILALAGRHGLTIFDPQSEEVYAPETN